LFFKHCAELLSPVLLIKMAERTSWTKGEAGIHLMTEDIKKEWKDLQKTRSDLATMRAASNPDLVGENTNRKRAAEIIALVKKEQSEVDRRQKKINRLQSQSESQSQSHATPMRPVSKAAALAPNAPAANSLALAPTAPAANSLAMAPLDAPAPNSLALAPLEAPSPMEQQMQQMMENQALMMAMLQRQHQQQQQQPQVLAITENGEEETVEEELEQVKEELEQVKEENGKLEEELKEKNKKIEELEDVIKSMEKEHDETIEEMQCEIDVQNDNYESIKRELALDRKFYDEHAPHLKRPVQVLPIPLDGMARKKQKM